MKKIKILKEGEGLPVGLILDVSNGFADDLCVKGKAELVVDKPEAPEEVQKVEPEVETDPEPDENEDEEEDDAIDYSKLKKKDLQELAKDRGIEIKARATSADLIAALTE